MAIKVIALGIYGTVLATDDIGNELFPRVGLEGLFEKCENRGIKVVSASDGFTLKVQLDLGHSGVNITKFDKCYQLTSNPKNYFGILGDYGIFPKELFVIGDSHKDVMGAMNCGSRFFMVPEYYNAYIGADFDLNSIEF
jgi:phosphoglycolate phosphatase-like HAD superfamily hydrolase